jgi:P27 family predicted phage terminase small subunit
MPGNSGRKPKPTNLKILEGNPGKRPLNKTEPKPRGSVVKPDWLDGYASEFWDKYAPLCEKLGVLTAADVPTFTGMCEHWHSWRTVKDEIRKPDFSPVNKHGQVAPACTLAKNSWNDFMKVAVEFGLTPSSRCRISLPGIPEEDENDAEFLGANAQ